MDIKERMSLYNQNIKLAKIINPFAVLWLLGALEVLKDPKKYELEEEQYKLNMAFRKQDYDSKARILGRINELLRLKADKFKMNRLPEKVQ